MSKGPSDSGSPPDANNVVVSLVDWRRAHEPALRPFRPARVMSVGGGATDRFTKGSDLTDLVSALLLVVAAGEPLGWLVVDGFGRVLTSDLPAGLDVTPLKATEELAAALEEHGTARCDGENSSVEFVTLADAVLACRFIRPGSRFDIATVVAHQEDRVARLVAGIRAEDPSVLPRLDIHALFAD